MKDKDVYVQKMHAKLDEWNSEIDRLKAKAEVVKAESRLEYRKQIEELQKKREEAENRIRAVREAGGDAWEDLKRGAESAWASMEEALKSARDRFS